MDDLITFVNARLDEIDPAVFHDRFECDFRQLEFFGDCSCEAPAWIRREVEAKRKLLAWTERTGDWAAENNLWTYDAAEPLKLLALPFSDHPHYQESWKP